jgi:hypothetical protein
MENKTKKNKKEIKIKIPDLKPSKDAKGGGGAGHNIVGGNTGLISYGSH